MTQCPFTLFRHDKGTLHVLRTIYVRTAVGGSTLSLFHRIGVVLRGKWLILFFDIENNMRVPVKWSVGEAERSVDTEYFEVFYIDLLV
jgi:hypothetical protein